MATGKPAQILDALLARLADLTLDPELPVSWPEVDFDPVTDAPDGKHLAVSFFPNRPAWEGVAAGVVDQGLLQVSVVWPKNEGLIAPHEVAASVMAWFPKGQEMISGTTKVKVYGEPWLSPPVPDTNRVLIPVTISWRAS